MLLLETILLLSAAKYSPSRRVRTLYCLLAYTWMPRLVNTLALLLGVAAFALAAAEGRI